VRSERGGQAARGVRIANARGGEGFIAVSAETPSVLARPRPHAAIAKHTNAFKINEDVVIRWTGSATIGRHRAHHIELSLKNKIA